MPGDDICVLEPCGTQADFVGQVSSCINFSIYLPSVSSLSVLTCLLVLLIAGGLVVILIMFLVSPKLWIDGSLLSYG